MSDPSDPSDLGGSRSTTPVAPPPQQNPRVEEALAAQQARAQAAANWAAAQSQHSAAAQHAQFQQYRAAENASGTAGLVGQPAYYPPHLAPYYQPGYYPPPQGPYPAAHVYQTNMGHLAYQPAATPAALNYAQSSSSREGSVAPSDGSGSSTTASTNSTATPKPDPQSRKKRRFEPGERPDDSGSGNPNNNLQSASHSAPDGALFQEIQNQFRQFQGQLDSIAQSVATEARDHGPSIATVQEDLMQQLVKGYQETAEILRILAQAPTQGGNPAGPSRGEDQDGNSMEIDPKAPALQALKVREEPKGRSPESVLLARFVREFFHRAFRGLADPELVAQWRPENGAVCSIEDFRLDLRAPPGSPWNKSARKVFVDAFFQQNIPEVVSMSPQPAAVANLFVSNFRTTRLKHQLSLKKARNADAATLELEAERQKRRRRERKRWMYYRRIRAAKRFDETKRHLPMIGLYGIDGMSTDESDHENGTGRPLYQILNKPWRNPRATATLRTLDALQRDMRFRPVRRAGPGAQPHNRVISGGVSVRAPVPGLPSDFYHPQWLSRQSDFVKRNLRITEDSSYDFAHDPHINDLAMGNHGQLNIIWGYA